MDHVIHSIETGELHPHPFNKKLYADDARPEEFMGLVKSIEEYGIKQPLIITKSGTILSGHRRHLAAMQIGLESLPCVYEETDNEEISLVEHNRYRKKTFSELMREAEVLLKKERERGAENQRLQTATDGRKTGGRSTAKVAKALGIGGHATLSKYEKVWDRAKTDPAVAAQIAKIDLGEKSVNAVWKSLDKKGKEDFGFDLQLYSSWNFVTTDPYLGIDHPGRIPGQIVENLIYYYTNPGALIVDPFGGGGITIDAAKRLRRRSLVMDIAPVRKDILEWDLTNGFPTEAEGCDLIFMDPPYWNVLQDDYEALSPDGAASLTFGGFQDWLLHSIQSAFETLKEGGYMAIIMMPQHIKLPEGVPYVDWPFECRVFMDQAGFVPIHRISRVWPSSIFTAHHVNWAKDTKTCLQIHGDIIIGKKVTE